MRRETRRAIVDAAARLFADRGYIGTSFDAIAEAAGVGRATVFDHFPTKTGLLKTAYDVPWSVMTSRSLCRSARSPWPCGPSATRTSTWPATRRS